MRIRVYPYKMASESARDVARGLKVLRVHPVGSYRPRRSDLIVNWGNAEAPTWDNPNMTWINKPSAVFNAIDKLKTFEILKNAGIRVPQYSTSPEEALIWPKIALRRTLTGTCGKGIEIALNPRGGRLNALPEVPLYVKYIDPSAEYRVHVFKDKVIDYAKKVKRDTEGVHVDPRTEDVRNHLSGWAFVREGFDRRESVEKIAIAAVRAMGLDFGAVDVIRSRKGNSFVLEINTAPGLSPKGVLAYINAIRELQGKEPLSYTIEHDDEDEYTPL